MKNTTIADLMQSSNVKFGTSGARGLVSDMTDEICYAYTLGFIQYLKQTGQLQHGSALALSGDLRESTPSILNACAKAAVDNGLSVINGGMLPTPAIASYGLEQHLPAIMVTGSHIPDDRNGIKFYKLEGEILKQDEELIRQQLVKLPEELFDSSGTFVEAVNYLPAVNTSVREAYLQRYLSFFPENALSGQKVGVYQHSGVARDIMVKLLQKLGAEVIALGFSEQFIPVDTEAIRDEDVELAKKWSDTLQLDAIVSTDGDADRPLVANEKGEWLRGDIVGILCASYLGITDVVTPVSCNTAVEKSNLFDSVTRTRIGSPFVIAAMEEKIAHSSHSVAGYEANGGFLLASEITRDGRRLSALPTRDAIIVILSLLHDARQKNCAISQLAEGLPERYTHSDRLKNFPTDKSREILKRYTSNDESENIARLQEDFADFGKVCDINTLDGLRITFANNDIIHFRPSGNAPEFRCYSESDSVKNALSLNQRALAFIASNK